MNLIRDGKDENFLKLTMSERFRRMTELGYEIQESGMRKLNQHLNLPPSKSYKPLFGDYDD